MDREQEAARSRRRSVNATVMANGRDVAPGRAAAHETRDLSMRRTVSSTGSHRPRPSGSGGPGERTRPGSRRESFHQAADESSSSGDLTAYYAFSRRKSSVIHEDAGTVLSLYLGCCCCCCWTKSSHSIAYEPCSWSFRCVGHSRIPRPGWTAVRSIGCLCVFWA